MARVFPRFPALFAELSFDLPVGGWIAVVVGIVALLLVFRHYLLVKFPLWIINHLLEKLIDCQPGEVRVAA